MIGDQGFYFLDMPDVVLGGELGATLVIGGGDRSIYRFTSFGIALIRQFPVTINGMVAAPLQFFAN